MTWDLQAGKARLGIAAGDTTKDAFVTAALNAALAIAESYCDRKFLYAAERATFNHPRGASLSLPRYPLEQITAVTGDTTGAAIKYHMESGTGLVILDGWAGGHKIAVDYAGGYKTLPDDLLLALWLIFDSLYASISQVGATGGAAGGGAIKSISSAGTSVTFDTSSGAAAASGLTGLTGSGLPMGAAAILSFYRRETA